MHNCCGSCAEAVTRPFRKAAAGQLTDALSNLISSVLYLHSSVVAFCNLCKTQGQVNVVRRLLADSIIPLVEAFALFLRDAVGIERLPLS